MTSHKFDYDLAVVGSGAAGSVAAEIASRIGKRVAIIEAAAFGGRALNVSDVPLGAFLTAAHVFDKTKRADVFGLRTSTISYNYPSIRAWKDLVLRRSGVQAAGEYLRSQGVNVFRGRAHFIGKNEISIGHKHISADKFLLATGAHQITPEISGLATADYLTPENALDLVKPPRTLAIIGGGATGVEFAELFAIFGTKVYLFEAKKRLLAEMDDEVSPVLCEIFTRERGMDVHLSSKVVAVEKDGPMTRLRFLAGETMHSVKVDRVLIATGREPNTDIGLENIGVEYDKTGVRADEYLATSARHVYAAGDILGRFGRTHAAIYEARIATRNLFAKTKRPVNYSAMPRVVWTDPEIATVGLTEADLVREDIKFRVSIAQNSLVARANIANSTAGFAKILTDQKGVVLGATIMAPHAAETIGELGVAAQNGLTAYQIAETIHPFGSWSETVRLAAAKIRT
jgi:pyruvate/2-oxoglutarate dehydrogenase complex dihydrolipoamide dehydrogenase (E3) component